MVRPNNCKVFHLIVWCGGFYCREKSTFIIFESFSNLRGKGMRYITFAIYIFLLWIFFHISRICHRRSLDRNDSSKWRKSWCNRPTLFVVVLHLFCYFWLFSIIRLLLPLAYMFAMYFLIAFISFPPRNDLWRYQIFIGLV